MERPLALRVGDSLTTESGVTLRAHKIHRRRITPGATSLHESAHIEAAQRDGGIYKATRIPGEDYEGATWPVVMTAFSAMAAKGDGHDGTFGDEMITRYGLHEDPDIAASAAGNYLAGRKEYQYEVASTLEEFGTIGQEEVNQAHRRVDDERRGNYSVKLEVVKPDGKKDIREVKSDNHHVMVKGEWYDLAA